MKGKKTKPVKGGAKSKASKLTKYKGKNKSKVA